MIKTLIDSSLRHLQSPDESNANAHSSINLRDGDATGSSYDPTDVDSVIKSRYENGNMGSFVVGGKYHRDIYNPNKGNRFGYDVYMGLTSDGNKKGLRIEKLNGKDHLVFDGWSIIDGYYHHDRHNQVTYIGAINLRAKERKIYKAKMTNMNAYNDLKWNFGSTDKKCPNSGSGAFQKYRSVCNMEYKWVGFQAYLPLDELFPKNGRDNEWELDIIKGVKGYGSLPSGKHINGTRYVISPLVTPYHNEKRSWSGQHANVVLTSGTNLSNVQMTTSSVIRRTQPRSSETGATRGYFKENSYYRWLNQNEDSGIVVWHGVRSHHDSNARRYAQSMYWDFGGNVALVKLERTHYDVGVEHNDRKSGETLLKESAKPYQRGNRTFHAKPKGYFTTPEGYNYVPERDNMSVNVNKDQTVTFYYKASLPDPSRIVEQDGGQNTHGHALGEAEWKLDKGDKPEKLPDPNEINFEWKDVTGGVEITKYIGVTKSVIVPETIDGKNVVRDYIYLLDYPLRT